MTRNSGYGRNLDILINVCIFFAVGIMLPEHYLQRLFTVPGENLSYPAE